jgi:hypothetical protein
MFIASFFHNKYQIDAIQKQLALMIAECGDGFVEDTVCTLVQNLAILLKIDHESKM